MKNLFTILLLFFFLENIYCADYFWVGGSGDWTDISHWSTSSAGATNHQKIPSYLDDVFFDENSFDGPDQEVKFKNTINCHNLDFSNVSNNPSFTGSENTLISINGAFILSQSMTLDFAGKIEMIGEENDLVINTAGNVLNCVFQVKGNGSFVLHDTLIVNQLFTLSAGGFSAGSKKIICQFLNISNIKNYDLVNFQIEVKGGIEALNGNSNLLYNAIIHSGDITNLALGSMIEFSGINPMINLRDQGFIGFEKLFFSNLSGAAIIHNSNDTQNSINISNIEFRSKASFNGGGLDIDTLILTEGNITTLSSNYTYKINHIIAPANCNSLITIKSSDSGKRAGIESEGNIILEYAVLKDIHAFGSGSFVVNNGVDLGNNDGWEINEVARETFYWIGDSGNWSDVNQWSLTSGGSPVQCLPGPRNHVVFDANSFSVANSIVNIDLPVTHIESIFCETGWNPTFSGAPENLIIINRSFYLEEDMSHEFEGDYLFESDGPDNLITTSGHTINGNLSFKGAGTWSFGGNINIEKTIFFHNGNLIMRNMTISANRLISELASERTLDISGSSIRLRENLNLQAEWRVNNLELDLISTNSQIEFSGSDNASFINDQVPAQNTNEYNIVHFQNVNGLVQNGANNTVTPLKVDSLLFDQNGSLFGRSDISVLQFSSGYTYSINNNTSEEGLIINELKGMGTCDGGNILLKSSDPYNAAKIALANDTELMSYHISGINMNGAGNVIATNSLDGGNNTNIDFSISINNTYYWINNSGDWQDPAHWSLTSGGPPAGLCVPTSKDNVVFDVNSFNLPNQVVGSKQGLVRNCHDITWENTFGNPNFVDSLITIYGSVHFDNSFNYNISTTNLTALETENIVLKGQSLNDVIINGSGEINFNDDLKAFNILHEAGHFNFNDIDAEINTLKLDGNSNSVTFGKSNIYLNGPYIGNEDFNPTDNFPLEINAQEVILPGEYDIYFTNATTGIYVRSSNTLNNIYANASGGSFTMLTNSDIEVNRADFAGNALFLATLYADSLFMFAGMNYELSFTGRLFVNEYIEMLGHNCAPINIFDNFSSSNENIILTSSTTILVDFVNMRNIVCTSVPEKYAGPNSINVNNSTQGWLFDDPNDPEINRGFLGADQLLCDNINLTLDPFPFNIFDSLLWADGSIGPTFDVTSPGTYSATVYFDSTCIISDDIEILEPMDINIGLPDNAEICEGKMITLVPGITIENAEYEWNNGSTSKALEVSENGVYILTVTVDECEFLDTVEVVVNANPGLDLGSDKALCEGETFDLEANIIADQYIWQDGSTDVTFSGGNEGTYWVEITDENCSFRDSVDIKYNLKPEIDLGLDTTICENEPLNLMASSEPDIDFQWQDGSTSSTLVVSEEGQYFVIASKKGCISKDTINVALQEVTIFTLGEDEIICAGEEISLEVPSISGSFIWENGSTESSRTITEAGEYSLEIFENGCSFIDQILIDVEPLPFLQLGKDTTVCDNEAFSITPIAVSSGILNWSDGSIGPSLKISEPGIYSAVIGNGNCKKEDEISIIFRDCVSFEIFIPNVFSPNEDGINDRFEIFFPDNLVIEKYQLEIFDRWGNKLYLSNQLQDSWDGTISNEKLNTGSYTYVIEVSYVDDFGEGNSILTGIVAILK